MERPLDQLIGHVRTVVVAGVNVVDARIHRRSQNGHGGVDIARRSPYVRPGQLHGAVAHPLQGH
jgi:hypothetical protein